MALWTFQVNDAALAFYARYGIVETLCTSDERNEEREPDVRLEWQLAGDPDSS